MAEVKNEDEAQQQQQQQQHAHGIPPKRKTDLTSIDEDKDENGLKKQRLENSAEKTCSSPALEKKIDGEDEEDDDEEDYEEEEEDDDEDEDEDEDDEDEDFDEKHSNGKMAEVDRKGKGILKEDKKGKGKLIQESDDDSSDDGGDGVESDGGDSSDLSEDPLAEVDLDNILPSRTRRRSTFHPGLCLSKNKRDP